MHRIRSRPIHFLFVTEPSQSDMNSAPQLSTSDEGHVTTALVISGFDQGDWVSDVKIRLMAVSVFPSPISSARMQPVPLLGVRPLMQLYRKRRPSFWCGLSFCARDGSRITGAVVLPFESTKLSWITKESGVLAYRPVWGKTKAKRVRRSLDRWASRQRRICCEGRTACGCWEFGSGRAWTQEAPSSGETRGQRCSSRWGAERRSQQPTRPNRWCSRRQSRWGRRFPVIFEPAFPMCPTRGRIA